MNIWERLLYLPTPVLAQNDQHCHKGQTANQRSSVRSPLNRGLSFCPLSSFFPLILSRQLKPIPNALPCLILEGPELKFGYRFTGYWALSHSISWQPWDVSYYSYSHFTHEETETLRSSMIYSRSQAKNYHFQEKSNHLTPCICFFLCVWPILTFRVTSQAKPISYSSAKLAVPGFYQRGLAVPSNFNKFHI